MKKTIRKVLTLLLVLLMLIGMFAGCGKKKPAEEGGTPTAGDTGKESPTDKGKPKVVRFGTYSQKSMDPTYKDPVTGESPMDPDRFQGAKNGMDAVKEKLNVDIKFVQYPILSSEDILKSVLANDPICDLAIIGGMGGKIVPQNVFQHLDQYADKFKDPEYKWMLPDKIYGHNFLLNWDMEFIRGECLSYNISYLEKVDALKENGKTVLPTDLWKQGKWTWSEFEKYLEKVSAYYANKKAPVRSEINIAAYGADLKIPAMNAIKANGGCIYSDNVLGVNDPGAKKAVAYVDGLYNKKLITLLEKNTPEARRDAMKNGEVVFTDLQNWVMNAVGEGLASRGEAMGVVPFPRPDDFSKDDKRYQPIIKCPGAVGLVKGISKEISDLSIDTFKLYYQEVFMGRTGSKSVNEYFTSKDFGKSEASLHGIDVVNEVYGQDMVDAYMAYNPTRISNEAYEMCPWSGDWDNLVRNSITGAEGSPKYDTAIEAQVSVYKKAIDDISAIVGSDKINDNMPPKIELVGKDIAIAKGTDPKTIDWSLYVKASDSVDGELDIKTATIDISKIKFDTVGKYDKSLAVIVKDKSGNQKKADMNVLVYDPDNKTAPTLTAKEKYREVKLNEDASKINWGKDFVEAATSAEGFDLKGYVTADISSLDVTTAGKYDVTLTATDYAGNKTDLKIQVTVAGK